MPELIAELVQYSMKTQAELHCRQSFLYQCKTWKMLGQMKESLGWCNKDGFAGTVFV